MIRTVVIVTVVLLVLVIGPQVLTTHSNRVELEVRREQVNVNYGGPPIYAPRLTITNKGLDPVVIREIRINNRSEEVCNVRPDRKYLVGESYVETIFDCGNLVRVMVKTDKDDYEFSW